VDNNENSVNSESSHAPTEQRHKRFLLSRLTRCIEWTSAGTYE